MALLLFLETWRTIKTEFFLSFLYEKFELWKIQSQTILADIVPTPANIFLELNKLHMVNWRWTLVSFSISFSISIIHQLFPGWLEISWVSKLYFQLDKLSAHDNCTHLPMQAVLVAKRTIWEPTALQKNGCWITRPQGASSSSSIFCFWVNRPQS